MSSLELSAPYPQPTPLPTNLFQAPSQQCQYLPQTPSPLRTSRNANLMPPPSNPRVKSSPLSEHPFSFDISSPIQPPEPDNENVDQSTDSSKLAFVPTFTSSTVFKSNQPFRFASRARSSSPQALLTNATASARDRRKSLFLDRIRQRRDDDRFADKGEQLLRMDWVRERREREERLARRAADASLGLDADDVMDDQDQDQDQPDEFSPTEEREIEELLSYMPDYNAESNETGGQHEEYSLGQDFYHQPGCSDNQAHPGDISDDEDYDRLFMEMDENDFDNCIATSSTANQTSEVPLNMPWNAQYITGGGQENWTAHADTNMDTS